MVEPYTEVLRLESLTPGQEVKIGKFVIVSARENPGRVSRLKPPKKCIKK